MLDRSKIPQGSQPNPFLFPDWEVKTLSNQLNVILLKDKSLPQVSFRLMFPFGSTEDGELTGIASVTSDLLSRGTEKRTSNQLYNDSEFIGGRINSGSNWDTTYIAINSLKKYQDKALELMSEVLFTPSFPESELKFIIDQRINNLLMNKDSTGHLANIAIGKLLFKDHPYENMNSGTEESLPKITREKVVEFYKNSFHPQDAVLVVVGDFDETETLKSVEAVFGNWKSAKKKEISHQTFTHHNKRLIYLIDKPDAVQSTIRVAHYGIDRFNHELPKITVMNTILGGYFGSRINMNIREDKGYTYGARTYFTERKMTGHFAAATDVRNEVTGNAVKEILFEMKKLQEEPVSSKELTTVVNYLVGRFPVDFETVDQLSNAVMESLIFKLPKNYFPEFRDALKKVTAEDVMACAKIYLNPDHAAIIVSGKSADVKIQLEQFGDVEVVDADGKKQNSN